MRRFLLATTALISLPTLVQAQSAAPETVVVYGTVPGSDIGLSRDKVPGTLQSLSASDITAGGDATVLGALGSRAAGVDLSDSQGNSMFQDVRYHGFEASPLQGVSQGMAVYQNGVRLNEAFGDTVNWDAIPEVAIDRMDMWSNNPVFGLNALGGAINLIMKNGFIWQGENASVQGGSYGHGQAALQYGMMDGNFSLYAAAEGVTDGGWRLQSDSQLGRLYADAGWRFGDSEIHIVASGSQSGLGVVGPTPVELIAQSSKAVYTYPQTTQNRIGSLAIDAKSKLADNWEIQGSVYVRSLRQRHVDGNDGNFEGCSSKSSFGGDLCLQDDAFGTPVGGKTVAFRNQFVIQNNAGQVFAFDNAIVYGTIDRTFTDTTTQGASLQLTGNDPLFGLSNYFTAGGSVDHSAIGFQSNSTLGRLYPNLDVALDPTEPGAGQIVHTAGNLGYAPVTGRHHGLLRFVCRRRAGFDRRPHRHRRYPRQCCRYRWPRPQQHQCRIERQPWLYPFQSIGGPDLQADGRHHLLRRLFGIQPRAHAAGTGLCQPDPALPAGRLAGRRPGAQAGGRPHRRVWSAW
jgi:iron complex outermembrane receptor protein